METRATTAPTIVGDIWSKLELDLSELHDLFNMRLETKEEAKGQKIRRGKGKVEWRDSAPRWEDDEHGALVRSWLIVPYVDAIDNEDIRERLEAGRRLFDSVHRQLATRELTPELFHEWGLLNRWAGALQLVYHMDPDARQLRAGDESLAAHRRWFAHYYLELQPRPKRDHALDVMEGYVNAIIKSLPDGPKRLWFSKFLGTVPSDSLEDSFRLTKAFREKLSISAMKKLAAQPLDSVPSFALTYPHP